jgi:uncharacterized protein YcfL
MKKILFLFLLTSIASCQSNSNTSRPAPATPFAGTPYTAAPAAAPASSSSPAPPSTDKRVFAVASLASTFRILNVKSTTAATGFLKIEVEVQNVGSKPKSFDYHIFWFDDSGTMFDLPDTVSVPLFLMGHEKSSIVAMAPTPLAKDFRVKFFPAQ